MKLEKIIINGFKSFADKTELVISHPITAIVGPNGCGKSNVVDALKWVLGNRSPKSLRSDQMADVIFSGSGSRKPSGMAEVSLIFSGVANADDEQDQLQISRRLFRNGDSEYLINNKSARLKDIKELFMDTGIGVSAYSIIEQGQISQLLKASAQDRRLIFEEAAGISKYKAHKIEAIRKLGRTEQNLLRLADIVNEVQKQLRSIKLQAGKARNYLEYSTRLKELRVNYSLSEYDRIINQRQSKQEKLAKWKDQFSETAANVARCDSAVSQISNTLHETESQINRWDNTLITARTNIERLTDRIGHLKHRIDELIERKKNASGQVAKLTDQTHEFSARLGECKQQQESTRQLFERRTAELQQAEEAIAQINSHCAELQAQLEDEKSGIIDIVRRTSQLHNEIQTLSSYRDNLSGRKMRLSGKAQEAENQLTEWLTEKAQQQAKMEDVRTVLGELQESLDAKRAEREAIGDQRSQVLEHIAEIKQQRSAHMSELNVLRDMEAKRQGLNEAVREILSSDHSQRSYIDGIVADVIVAQPQYAQAVEAALEGMTDALLINSTGQFLQDRALQEALDSRIRVICSDRLAPFKDQLNLSECRGVIGRLVEFVDYGSAFSRVVWHLLGNVLLVDSLDAAMNLSARFGTAYRYVTPDGQVFTDGCFLNIGPVGKKAGLISRKSRIQELEAELETLNTKIQSDETVLEETEHKDGHLESLCKDLRTSIYEATTEKSDADSRLRVLDENIRRLKDEQPIIAGEIGMLEEEIQDSVQKEHGSRQKLEECEQVETERKARIEQLQAQLEEQQRVQQSRNAELTEIKIYLGQVNEQQKSITQQIAGIQSQLHHSRIAIESARTEAVGCDEQIEQTERNILATESEMAELYVEKEQAQKHSVQLHRAVEELIQERKQNEEDLRTYRSRQTEVEENTHQLELSLSQLQVKEEDMIQRVREELQIELAQAYESFEQEDVNWDEVREEIKMLRGKIDRLGNVNVDAIDQQKDLEERYDFLAAQVEDLNQSKIQLEQLIDKINKESLEKFRTTFEDIRENFQQIFRKLFGGGKADILLDNPEDILESGIDIVARPPGKEPRTISLLSGGEKTMTAIALLFSVFKSKPSPFCVLDEVDAALDEANNERFNLIVQEFQKMSQFIVITHSKRTMSIADVLYGITMQTQGVSKKISVQFEGKDSDSEAAVA
ncbi:MAG: chromosome segregation protein SMC [Planctomycetota bacterium]|jgi:chromosome segregation protein